jgi:hypothetical protein
MKRTSSPVHWSAAIAARRDAAAAAVWRSDRS